MDKDKLIKEVDRLKNIIDELLYRIEENEYVSIYDLEKELKRQGVYSYELEDIIEKYLYYKEDDFEDIRVKVF